MSMPNSYIAYAPDGRGLLCAVFYLELPPDLYGWWIGRRGEAWCENYFKLEHWYAPEWPVLLASRGQDLYGGWALDYSEGLVDLGEAIPAAEDVCHRLEEEQARFCAEWLFFGDDPAMDAERAAYAALRLPLAQVNVRSHRLDRLDKAQAVWRHFSGELSREIMEFLTAHWPLDYR